MAITQATVEERVPFTTLECRFGDGSELHLPSQPTEEAVVDERVQGSLNALRAAIGGCVLDEEVMIPLGDGIAAIDLNHIPPPPEEVESDLSDPLYEVLRKYAGQIGKLVEGRSVAVVRLRAALVPPDIDVSSWQTFNWHADVERPGDRNPGVESIYADPNKSRLLVVQSLRPDGVDSGSGVEFIVNQFRVDSTRQATVDELNADMRVLGSEKVEALVTPEGSIARLRPSLWKPGLRDTHFVEESVIAELDQLAVHRGVSSRFPRVRLWAELLKTDV
jgi:hypothetical protein